ncbi:MAG: hypothetical protein CVU05_08490 [Bacteroidetes bacterium HGW-Bacteroidetes-21]|jgi:hypothetical protein|nr:MAG: hypothetical protein CVU05_08490 [Bacteroidetes bacterium HGW-Bacteroidetes-21]
MLETNNPTLQATEISIEEKLRALYKLQLADTQIDRIRTLRGELPLEVQDLEDEIAGIQTRIDNISAQINQADQNIQTKKTEITQAELKIKKYTEQQKDVRNSREYDAFNKEIEFQQLEIQLCNKRIKEFTDQIAARSIELESSTKVLDERANDLHIKKQELEEIVSETQKEEETLTSLSEDCQKFIEPRLLGAYKRIRANTRNGLAVVVIERDSCGGCFNKIPPQRQLEIRTRKKIIPCEYCGRILVDKEIAGLE